jgi:hypothetical protein
MRKQPKPTPAPLVDVADPDGRFAGIPRLYHGVEAPSDRLSRELDDVRNRVGALEVANAELRAHNNMLLALVPQVAALQQGAASHAGGERVLAEHRQAGHARKQLWGGAASTVLAAIIGAIMAALVTHCSHR